MQRLARHAKMSARTFNRRFREETGQSPGVWVRNRRIDRARELLESQDLPVDEVARLVRARLRRQPASPSAPRGGDVAVELSQGLPGVVNLSAPAAASSGAGVTGVPHQQVDQRHRDVVQARLE